LSGWGIPALYALAAIVAALTFPRIESRIFSGLVSPLSLSSATAIDSAIGSGMIALTGIVFSLAFVMDQFSATAYSLRLVPWISRDPVMSHALGIFTATFLYALAGLAGIDRNRSGRVPFVSTSVVIGLLLASVAMLIALNLRIGSMQINRMLVFTGDEGRKVIPTTYPSTKSAATASESCDYRTLPCSQTLVHVGRPRYIQAIEVVTLVNLSRASGGVIEMALAVGDTVVEGTSVLHIFGARQLIEERKLWNGIEIGGERAFEQDPKYAIRLLADIAIRAFVASS